MRHFFLESTAATSIAVAFFLPGWFSATPSSRVWRASFGSRVWAWLPRLVVFWLVLAPVSPVRAARSARDTPFLQDVSVKIAANPELEGAEFRKVAINRDGIVYVLTDRGVARLFGHTLGLDHSFRPLAGLRPRDITMESGELFYLYADQFLANGRAGRPQTSLPPGRFEKFALARNGAALLAGPTNLALARAGQLLDLDWPPGATKEMKLFSWREDLFVMTDRQVFRREGQRWRVLHEGPELATLGFRAGEMFIGTRRGFYAMDLATGKETLARQTRLPVTHITCLAPDTHGVWAGTPRGLFHWRAGGEIRYYASKRWLADDAVIDIAVDHDGSVFALTRGGLSKIAFQQMTLAEKAMHYERKIRQRHLRYGLCSELRLPRPGDISSAEMIDTDNDGSWSAYYMASQAFRFGATGDPQAHANAWETFEALERLESINGLRGFPSRTIERKGFKYSDPDRWHTAPEAGWEWKGTTSSDEFTDHTFGYAVLWECAAKTPGEKQRIAALYDKIIGHIVRNHWYLVDVDGKPTLWARWNPEYVNWFPFSIVDRKLNSVEIIAGLQFAHRVTGKELYRDKAFELFNQHGYLANIRSSMKLIAPTRGYVHQGNDMGDEWNHSDDQLAFDTYWTLCRYAFNGRLRRQYAAVVADHFELEKHERIPIWNFVTAMTGAKDHDLEGALWTLRRFPLDLISWTVRNSHREDITKLPKNFRGQQLKELLPPGERRISRWNTHPFILDGGEGGRIEYAGDEFLLPYWMARYHRLIR